MSPAEQAMVFRRDFFRCRYCGSRVVPTIVPFELSPFAGRNLFRITGTGAAGCDSFTHRPSIGHRRSRGGTCSWRRRSTRQSCHGLLAVQCPQRRTRSRDLRERLQQPGPSGLGRSHGPVPVPLEGGVGHGARVCKSHSPTLAHRPSARRTRLTEQGSPGPAAWVEDTDPDPAFSAYFAAVDLGMVLPGVL